MKRSKTNLCNTSSAFIKFLTPFMLSTLSGCGGPKTSAPTSVTTASSQEATTNTPKDWIDRYAGNLLGAWEGNRLAHPSKKCRVEVNKETVNAAPTIGVLFKDDAGKNIGGTWIFEDEFTNDHTGSSSLYTVSRTTSPFDRPFGVALNPVGETTLATFNDSLVWASGKYGSVSILIFPEVEIINCVNLSKVK